MFSTRKVLCVSIAVLTALSFILWGSSFLANAQSTNSLGADPIIGTWRVTVSFDDGRPNVLALYTFDRDRNFVMDGSWPGLFGGGHGTWNQSSEGGNSAIGLTFFRLLYTPVEQNEATGALNATFNGTLKVQGKLTVSDDQQSFTGRYLLTNFDSNGNIRSTTTGGFSATRLVFEPLP